MAAVTVSDWLEAQAERMFVRQRALADTMMLVATFATAVCATIVATALQVSTNHQRDDRFSAVLLGGSFVAALLVIALDRITEVDQSRILAEAKLRGWTDKQVIDELRTATVAACYANSPIIKQMKFALGVQLVLSLLASSIAAVSLLR